MRHDVRLHDEGLETLDRWRERAAEGSEEVQILGGDEVGARAKMEMAVTFAAGARERFVEARIEAPTEMLSCSPAELVDEYMKALGMEDAPVIACVGHTDQTCRIGIVATRVTIVTRADGEMRPRLRRPRLEEGARRLRELQREASQEVPRTLTPAPAQQGWRASIEKWEALMAKIFQDRRVCEKKSMRGEVVARREFGNRAVGLVIADPRRYMVTVTRVAVSLPEVGDYVEVERGTGKYAAEAPERATSQWVATREKG